MTEENYERYINIPKQRVGALIGKEGKHKEKLEFLTQAKIEIDSASGEVTIIKDKADAYTFYKLEIVVKAVGRGFSPEKAKFLLEEGYELEVINIRDFDIKTGKATDIKRGRVIGSGGAIRTFIEDLLDVYVSVYGKTVSIIGKGNNNILAKEAIVEILEGANLQSIKKRLRDKAKRTDSTPEEW